MAGLPPVLPWQEVQKRLGMVYPQGTSARHRLVNDIASKTVFTAIYINAVDGSGIQLAPKHVYRMTQEQSGLITDAHRLAYATAIMKAGGHVDGERWYLDNTRESIRDDTLREALVATGAVIEDTTVATTSGKGRYALQAAFAALMVPALQDEALDQAINEWRGRYLTAGALARVAIVRAGAATGGTHVQVTFPNGETRRLKAGPSSVITKDVIEVFSPRFLGDPAVLFVSESGNKVVARDEKLATAIGLSIQSDKDLPDIILVDLKPAHPLLVFVEVVATDGPIGVRRKAALEKIAEDAGFDLQHVAFVTAYLDRSQSTFKRTAETLAWGTFAWFAGEPEHIVELSEGRMALR
ncbi:restriction endonuclease [Rhizobium leguminosarum]|uniref:BsuBI/PstI family type II restriction endonuclease n=1 Tax=Rhizobium leguminosarum TaxID=384 RepID=UPI000517C087|nr:BsuBI/PstI family type II restriction endonuclease [Rhizobium leguminosarum]MBY5325622.1 restriction endonuclease [Rhizobium leguminosarum]NEI96284.1 restriction endonuclease [Rhizobium leguminosarum]NEJ82773.1 restriction endonuclease [Rhizobium leguminosarum]